MPQQKYTIAWLCPSKDVTTNRTNNINLNMNYWIMQSYYTMRGKYSEQLEWMDPEYNGHLTSGEVFQKHIYAYIICVSCFQWNIGLCQTVARSIKKRNPNAVVIAGGPSCYAHRDSDKFFAKYPEFDYVVYGDGEKPFVALMDKIIGGDALTDTVNLVERDTRKKWPFEVFNDKEFWDHSVILEHQDHIKATYEKYQPDFRHVKLHWEIDRGCPYSCTFCDWSSGLHHKVKRRRKHIYEEIDFLASLHPMVVSLPSANFGIFPEDLDIAKYLRKINFQNIRLTYMAKMNKERVYQIHKIMASYNKVYQVNVSIQDFNQEVLDAIQRPEIEWAEHKVYLRDFRRDFPNHLVTFEIMIGVPLQTPESMIDLLHGIDEVQRGEFRAYPWFLLPNSPGYNLEYQKRYGLKFHNILIPMQRGISADERIINKKNYVSMQQNEPDQFFRSELIRSSDSFSFAEFIEMQALLEIYNKNQQKTMVLERLQIPRVRRIIKQRCEQIAQEIDQTNMFAAYDDVSERFVHLEHYWSLSHVVDSMIGHQKVPLKIVA